MEPTNIIFDNKTDIFYNDYFLKVLNTKDYVLDIKKQKYKINPNVEYVNSGTKKIENDNIDFSINKIKNILYVKFMYKISISRFVKNRRGIIINYIFNKYIGEKINDKKILNIELSSLHMSNENVLFKKNLISSYIYIIYKKSKSNKIYSWLTHNENNLKSFIKNKKNEYYLLNNNNNGDILYKKNFELLKKKIIDKKFDVIFIRLNPYYYNIHNENFINKYIIMILYLLLNVCNNGCNLIIHHDMNKYFIKYFISIMSNYFKKTKILHSKFHSSFLTNYKIIIFNNFITNKNLKNDILNLEKIINNKKFFDINTSIINLNLEKNSIMDKEINKYLKKIKKMKLKKMYILMYLTNFLTNKQYKKLKEIITYKLKIKQFIFAKKNLKYLKF